MYFLMCCIYNIDLFKTSFKINVMVYKVHYLPLKCSEGEI